MKLFPPPSQIWYYKPWNGDHDFWRTTSPWFLPTDRRSRSFMASNFRQQFSTLNLPFYSEYGWIYFWDINLLIGCPWSELRLSTRPRFNLHNFKSLPLSGRWRRSFENLWKGTFGRVTLMNKSTAAYDILQLPIWTLHYHQISRPCFRHQFVDFLKPSAF